MGYNEEAGRWTSLEASPGHGRQNSVMLSLLCSKSICNGLWLPEHWVWGTLNCIWNKFVESQKARLFLLFFCLFCCVAFVWHMLTWKRVKLSQKLQQSVGLNVSTLSAWPLCSLSAISREKAVELLRKCLEEVSSSHGILKGMFCLSVCQYCSRSSVAFFLILARRYNKYPLTRCEVATRGRVWYITSLFFHSWVTFSSMSIL